MTTPTVSLPHPPDDTADGDCTCSTCDAYWSSGLDRPFVILGNTTTARLEPLDLTPVVDDEAPRAAARAAEYDRQLAEDLAALGVDPTEPDPDADPRDSAERARYEPPPWGTAVSLPTLCVVPEPEPDAPWMRLFATPADFDGTGEPHPHLLATTAGGVLLYADATNWIGGAYKSGKSWVGVIASAHADRTLYLDYETTAPRLAERMTILGAHDQIRDPDRFLYPFRPADIWYDHGDGTVADRQFVERTQNWLSDTNGNSLVVVDTSGRSGCPTDGDADGVYAWAKQNIDPWREAGATVLVVDHVPKGKDRSPGPIGSIAKGAIADLVIEVPRRACWSQTTDGRIGVVHIGERIGQVAVPTESTLAVINGTWRDEAFGYTIDPPTDDDDTVDERDLVIERRILAALAADGQIVGIRDLKVAAKRGQDAALGAVARLTTKGLIERIPHGNAHAWIERAESQ